MENFYIVSPDEYRYARAIYRNNLNNLKIYTQNLEVLDNAFRDNIKYIEFVQINQNPTDINRCQYRADFLARTFDAEISQLRRIYFQMPCSAFGWDYLNKFFIIFKTLRWLSVIPSLIVALKGVGKINLFSHQNEQDYYFNSYISSDILVASLEQAGIDVTLHKTSNISLTKDIGADFSLKSLDASTYDTLVHIPTTFYSAANIKSALDKNFDKYVEIGSPYFDVKIGSARIELEPSTSSPDSKEFIQEVFHLEEELFNNLGCQLLNKKNHFRQVRRIFSQVNVYEDLMSGAYTKIKKLIISDHDTGLQGPLLAYANEKNIPIFMFPHSKYCVMPTQGIKKGYKSGYVNDYDGYPDLGLYKSSFTNRLIRKAENKISRPVNVLILLNELDDVSNLSYENNFQLIDLVLQTYLKLNKLGVPVSIRMKPSHSYKEIFHRLMQRNKFDVQINYSDGNISDLSKSVTHCFSFGAPSTAISYFYTDNCAIYHISNRVAYGMDGHTLPNDVNQYSTSEFILNIDTIFDEISNS